MDGFYGMWSLSPKNSWFLFLKKVSMINCVKHCREATEGKDENGLWALGLCVCTCVCGKTYIKFTIFKLLLSIQFSGKYIHTVLLPSPPSTSRTFSSSKWNSATTAKLLQSCLTLCIPIDGSPPGSPVPGILQARTLEWVAISFSNTWTWKVKVKSLSRVWLFATTWTAAYQAPPPMGFSRQEYWSGVPSPSPFYGCLPNALDYIRY